jgi:signal peptidase II
MNHIGRIVAIAFAVFAADGITKSLACSNLAAGQSIKIIPGIFHITLVLNKGAAFGLFRGQRLFFIALSVIVISFLLIHIFRKRPDGVAVSAALGLITGGALGNLADRIRLGYVIDFLDFRIWPVFNIADSAITVGTIILILALCIRSSSK